LQFGTEEEAKAEPNKVLVELASLVEMPYTIFTFLDLVDLQAFDGTAIVGANNTQIEGGDPRHAPNHAHAVKLQQRYNKFGYNDRGPLAFIEHSPNYNHEKFTIGFQGSPRPGPALAINMADNADQRSGEPCFGKVVKGFDTLVRIQTAPKNEDGYRLQNKVVIEKVRLVRDQKEAAQQES
jgi:cyclophilin family peptidyl-prolyl cis-trans isomerase